MRKAIKTFLFILSVMTLLCIVSGCGATEQNSASVPETDTNITDNNTESRVSENESIVNESNTDDSTEKNTDGENKPHILVAYFSATGTTKKVAETTANVISADLYEITPKEPYTDNDLDYGNSSSRTSVEMNDNSSRPEISGTVENMEDYDIIFLGYPIWWGEAPHIIYTFMESYDFSGKTIIPFCTSASSGIGSSAENIHSSISDGGMWLDGDRLNGSSSRNDIAEWINGLDLGVNVQ